MQQRLLLTALSNQFKMNFVWNEEKSKTNLAKHHIAFDTAIYVFTDPNRVEIYDQKHSIDEDRYIVICYCESVLLLVYSILDDDTYRIISARKELRGEVNRYYFQNDFHSHNV